LHFTVNCSLDTSGRALSVEKEVLEGQRHASNAKHKVSVAASTSSEGDKSNNDSITAQSSLQWQGDHSFDDTAPMKQRVTDDESSKDEPIGVTTVQLEHTV